LAAISDPATLLRSLQIALRDRQMTARERAVTDRQQDVEQAQREHAEAVARAARASRKASDFLGLGDTLSKIAEVAAVAATVSAAVGTGGAATPLAIGGAALLLGGKGIAEEGTKLGLSEEVAGAIGTTLELTGSLMMAGSGLVSSAASASSELTTLEQLAEWGEPLGQALSAASSAVAGGMQVVGAIHALDQDEAMIEAEVASFEAEVETQAFDDEISDARKLLRSFEGVRRRLDQASQAQERARAAAVGTLA
jgi:hypothetical protein